MDAAIKKAVPGPVALGVFGDARLVRLAARGDRRAFAAIFHRYHQHLYRYCRAITGNAEDAADSLQNTMLKVMAALPGEHRKLELKPWLFRVAHNEAVSVLRRRRQDFAPADEELLATADVEAELAAREEVRELLADLRELPERQRAVVILRELNGLGYEEIAAIFATSPAAAKQAAYDGRVALKELSEGRSMSCEEVMRTLSDADGKPGRSRTLRAHLRSCESCAGFRASIQKRRESLRALAPPLPALASAGLMEQLFGGGSGGGGAVGASAAAGKIAGGASVLKSGTALLAVMTVAAGAGIGREALSGPEPQPPKGAAAAKPGPSGDPASAQNKAKAPSRLDAGKRSAAGGGAPGRRERDEAASRPVAPETSRPAPSAPAGRRPELPAPVSGRGTPVQPRPPVAPPPPRTSPTIPPAPERPAPAEPLIEAPEVQVRPRDVSPIPR